MANDAQNESLKSPAPTSLCRRRRAGQFWSAAARRPAQKTAGAGGRGPNTFFLKVPEKISFYSQNFLMTFSVVIDRKLQQNKYTATMALAARRKIIGGGAPINKSRRQRQQIVGGGAAGARL